MPSILPNPPRLYLSELSRPERALLLALRALLDPAEGRGWVMWDFGRLFRGSEAPALAFTALTGLVRLLAARGRRRPRVHAFEDHAVAADERTVLALCAALQAGHRDHAEALLAWLLPAAARGAGFTYAAALAGMMAENGARLYPRRRAAAGASRGIPEAGPLMRVGPVGAHPDVGDQRHA